MGGCSGVCAWRLKCGRVAANLFLVCFVGVQKCSHSFCFDSSRRRGAFVISKDQGIVGGAGLLRRLDPPMGNTSAALQGCTCPKSDLPRPAFSSVHQQLQLSVKLLLQGRSRSQTCQFTTSCQAKGLTRRLSRAFSARELAISLNVQERHCTGIQGIDTSAEAHVFEHEATQAR